MNALLIYGNTRVVIKIQIHFRKIFTIHRRLVQLIHIINLFIKKIIAIKLLMSTKRFHIFTPIDSLLI